MGTVDIFPCQIDDGFRAIQKSDPFAEMIAIPFDFPNAIVPRFRRAGEQHHVIPGGQIVRQSAANKTAAACQNDALSSFAHRCKSSLGAWRCERGLLSKLAASKS